MVSVAKCRPNPCELALFMVESCLCFQTICVLNGADHLTSLASFHEEPDLVSLWKVSTSN